MEENKIKVNGEEIKQEEFNKLKESVTQDKTKLLKEVKPKEYKILEKMNG